MTIGEIKQAIRQRCRFDPRLTDDYILNYIKQGLAKFSLRNKVLDVVFTIDMTNYSSDTVVFNLPKNYVAIKRIEVGTVNDFNSNLQIVLDSGKDYEIIVGVRNQNTGIMEDPQLRIYYPLQAGYLIKVYYSGYIDTVFDDIWNINGGYVDNAILELAIQPLIEYVAYQHKKNYLKDQFRISNSTIDRICCLSAQKKLFERPV